MTPQRLSLVLAAVLVTTAVLVGGCAQCPAGDMSCPKVSLPMYGGPVIPSHGEPGGCCYYKDWDPVAASIELTPAEDTNPVATQHVLIATVMDKDGKPLIGRRVEWLILNPSVGAFVEVDESGYRPSRGYKMDNQYAVTHTNTFAHTLTRGNDDPEDDIVLQAGQTWAVITSAVEGDTHVVAYAPGIYDWDKHKAFAVKHWRDVIWEWPPDATNPIGTQHTFTTKVTKFSDRKPLAGYDVTYAIESGPEGMLEPGGGKTATVTTGADGTATVTLRQARPAEGVNELSIRIHKAGDGGPPMLIAQGRTRKTWVGPKIALRKTAPATARVGENFEYTLTVTNPSNVTATNVVLTDTLPEGIDYVSSSPAAQASGRTLTWNLGSLAGGGQVTGRVTVKGERSGSYTNPASAKADYGLMAEDQAVTMLAEAKLVVEKTAPAEVLICDPIEYVVLVRNTGDAPATNVKVNDTLPEGLTTLAGNQSVMADMGTLAPGEAKQTRFSAKASKPGQFTNVVKVTGDGGLAMEKTADTIVREPVLVISKSAPRVRYVGRPISYEITVSNRGDAPSRQTVLTDMVPAGTNFVQASDNGRHAGGKITWELGTLEPNQAKTVSATLTGEKIGVVKNMASVSGVCAPEQMSETSTEVRGIPAILLELVDTEDPIEVGTNETYVITVTNQGSAVDTDIVITATLPAEMQYVSSEGPTRAAVEGQTVTFAPLARLEAGRQATWKVVAKGVRPGDVRLRIALTSARLTTPVEETEPTTIYAPD